MIHRIKKQAEVIDIVNSLTLRKNNLTGLTLSAIADWSKRNSALGISDIRTLLEDISNAIGVYSNTEMSLKDPRKSLMKC